MATVLLASLGESPAVVTAMYDLLTEKQNIPIDFVDVLCPQDWQVRLAYDLVENEFKDKCALRPLALLFKDANSEKDAIDFLEGLYQYLHGYQENRDTVYLSLAGGRKSMAALMAWVAPFFPCIQGLYHVVDPHDESFPSIDDMTSGRMNDVQIRQAMHPDWNRIFLVKIPFGKEQHISQELHDHLLNASVEELVDEGFDEEAVDFTKAIGRNEKSLDVWLSKRAADQYYEYYKRDPHHARGFEICFERMRFASMVRSRVRDHVNDKQNKTVPVPLHFFKRKRSETVERPVFYTSPKDIKHCADHEVKEVVVCELEVKRSGRYRSLKEITDSSNFSYKKEILAEKLPSVKYADLEECILMIPLGQTPMVATQLYTLLTEREGRKIKKIVLICPGANNKIIAGAELVQRALQDHMSLHDKSSVSCKQVRIPKLKDILTEEHCQEYQSVLEEEIQSALNKYSPQQIILALSGGRKGMTAMTIFAAQKKRIPYVYHTLITDEKLSEDIEKRAGVSDLRKLSRQDLDEQLFLGKYKGDGSVPYPDFAIFRVPVFPAQK